MLVFHSLSLFLPSLKAVPLSSLAELVWWRCIPLDFFCMGTSLFGCCGEFSKQLLSGSIFSFSFPEISPIQAPGSKQAPGFSHSPAWLSPKTLAADPVAWPGDFSRPVPHAGPKDLIVLKHNTVLLTV